MPSFQQAEVTTSPRVVGGKPSGWGKKRVAKREKSGVFWVLIFFEFFWGFLRFFEVFRCFLRFFEVFWCLMFFFWFCLKSKSGLANLAKKFCIRERRGKGDDVVLVWEETCSRDKFTWCHANAYRKTLLKTLKLNTRKQPGRMNQFAIWAVHCRFVAPWKSKVKFLHNLKLFQTNYKKKTLPNEDNAKWKQETPK